MCHTYICMCVYACVWVCARMFIETPAPGRPGWETAGIRRGLVDNNLLGLQGSAQSPWGESARQVAGTGAATTSSADS